MCRSGTDKWSCVVFGGVTLWHYLVDDVMSVQGVLVVLLNSSD